MIIDQTQFSVRLAQSQADIDAAQRLRYAVFVEEMGSRGVGVDHAARIERDAFDPHVDHLLLTDANRDGEVVGVYRLLTDTRAREIGGFYSANEYDLSPLLSSNRKLLELGRSCLHKDYRGGVALHFLWSGLARYVLEHEIEVLFGVASFPGTDVGALQEPLTYLHTHHLASPQFRVRALPDHHQTMQLMPVHKVNRSSAMRAIPPLIKAYLRLGGVVGDGAFVDHAFKTVDVCLIMDTARMNEQMRRRLVDTAL